MDVYIESLMSSNSFLAFEIGTNLNLSSFTIEDDYNPVGNDGSAYYFFNKEIDIEISERDGLIHSFDILLQNQRNDLYLGDKERNRLRLNDCSFSDFMSYINISKLDWNFERILAGKSISIAYYSKLKMSFYFDCNAVPPPYH